MKSFRMTPLAAAVLAVYAIPGLAQDGPSAVAAAESTEAAPERTKSEASEAVVLPKVTVQGQEESPYKAEPSSSKYTAPLRDTPKSVTIIPISVLRDNAVTSLQDALRVVPGISFVAGEGGTAIGDRPTIRGLASGNSIFIDGIRDIGSQTRDTFALESVEVSKGADSAFGGRGSGGGSINLVTKQAHVGDDAFATATIGSSDTVRGTLDKNWQINDSTAARINVLGSRGVVPGRDDAVDYDKWGVAGSLAFGLGSPTRITMDYYHLTDNGMPDYSIPYDPATGKPITESKDVDRDNFYGLANRDFRESDTDIGTIAVSHDLDGGYLLRNVTRYGTSTNDYLATNPDDSAGNVNSDWVWRSPKSRWSETDTFSNTTALSGAFDTGAIKHSINAGLEVSREKRDQDGYSVFNADGTPSARVANCATNTAQQDNTGSPSVTTGTGNCTSLYDPNPNFAWAGSVKRTGATTHYTTDTTGIYAFDTITLTPQWLVNLGLRWDDYTTQAERAAGTNVAGTAYAAVSSKASDSFFNYQGGLVFKPTPTSSIYASYSTESTPISISGGDEDVVTPAIENLKPEESRTMEVGTKWELFRERLMLTAAVFDTERKNANITIDSSGTTDQIGKTRVRGAELSFTGNITRAWQVFGGYSYLDSELVKGAFANPATAVILAEGQQLPNTPKNSFSLFTTYKVTPKASIGGGAYYVSKVYGNTAETTTSKAKYVPDYWRFDVNANYEISKNFSAQVNVQNLTDETYYTKAFTTHYAQLGPGRQYLFSLNMMF